MEQSESRVQELVPIRYGRMSASPFTFYRGAAAIMAADLGVGPNTGLTTQLCGDAHLANFGVYSSPERRLVFDVNDFDESHPGPWEWDVKRLVASFAVAGRHRGFSAAERRTINEAVGASYRNAMAVFSAMSNLEVWYAHADIDQALQAFSSAPEAAMLGKAKRKDLTRAQMMTAKAKTRTSLQAFNKMTINTEGSPEFLSQPPLLVPIRDLMTDDQADSVWTMLRGGLSAYRRSLQDDRKHLLSEFEVVDGAHKIVGVGSVGAAWYCCYSDVTDDPLVLQVATQQSYSSPTPPAASTEPRTTW
jgi:uncharacterized protein (DUF2252 family)